MVSRRNYFTIMILMIVVFFLCMTFNTLKDTWNDYEVNPYSETAENYPSKVNIYIPESIRLGKAAGRTFCPSPGFRQPGSTTGRSESPYPQPSG